MQSRMVRIYHEPSRIKGDRLPTVRPRPSRLRRHQILQRRPSSLPQSAGCCRLFTAWRKFLKERQVYADVKQIMTERFSFVGGVSRQVSFHSSDLFAAV